MDVLHTTREDQREAVPWLPNILGQVAPSPQSVTHGGLILGRLSSLGQAQSITVQYAARWLHLPGAKDKLFYASEDSIFLYFSNIKLTVFYQNNRFHYAAAKLKTKQVLINYIKNLIGRLSQVAHFDWGFSGLIRYIYVYTKYIL